MVEDDGHPQLFLGIRNLIERVRIDVQGVIGINGSRVHVRLENTALATGESAMSGGSSSLACERPTV